MTITVAPSWEALLIRCARIGCSTRILEPINKTPVKDWGTLSEKAPFKAHKLLKAIRCSLKPEFQKNFKSLCALEYELEERHRRRKERAVDTTNQINKY